MKNTWTGFTTLMIVAATAGYSRATSLSVTNGLAFHLTAICGALNASGKSANRRRGRPDRKDQSPKRAGFAPTFSTRRPTFQARRCGERHAGTVLRRIRRHSAVSGITAEIRSLFIVMKPETAVAAGFNKQILMNCSPTFIGKPWN